jgi:hypothetical protein
MKKSENSLKRPYTVTDLYRMKLDVLEFRGPWLASFGKPEVRGAWIIYGPSFEGKTRFAMMMAKYFAQNFGKVLYDSLEEGKSKSVIDAFRDVEMETVGGNIHLLDQEPIFPDLVDRLKLRKSARFIFIDSIQYTWMEIADYKERLLKQFPDKLFIFTSHAKGRDPKGALAEAVWYDSFVKIQVEGFRAFPKSRYGGGAHFDIWAEEAEKYWAKKS